MLECRSICRVFRLCVTNSLHALSPSIVRTHRRVYLRFRLPCTDGQELPALASSTGAHATLFVLTFFFFFFFFGGGGNLSNSNRTFNLTHCPQSHRLHSKIEIFHSYRADQSSSIVPCINTTHEYEEFGHTLFSPSRRPPLALVTPPARRFEQVTKRLTGRENHKPFPRPFPAITQAATYTPHLSPPLPTNPTASPPPQTSTPHPSPQPRHYCSCSPGT